MQKVYCGYLRLEPQVFRSVVSVQRVQLNDKLTGAAALQCFKHLYASICTSKGYLWLGTDVFSWTQIDCTWLIRMVDSGILNANDWEERGWHTYFPLDGL